MNSRQRRIARRRGTLGPPVLLTPDAIYQDDSEDSVGGAIEGVIFAVLIQFDLVMAMVVIWRLLRLVGVIL